MNKYYVLLLNNCYDINEYFIPNNYCTMFPNIKEKEYCDLSTIYNDFMHLDNKIKTNDNNLIVSGSFPVIGEMIDDKMYDVITRKEIKYTKETKEVNGLSYQKEYLINNQIIKSLFDSLNKNELDKYVSYMSKIEEYSKKIFNNYKFKETYYLIVPNTIRVDTLPLIIKRIDNQYIELFTKEKCHQINNNIITSNLSFNYKESLSLKEAESYQLSIIDRGVAYYLEAIKIAKNNAINLYNEYKIRNSMDVKKLSKKSKSLT